MGPDVVAWQWSGHSRQSFAGLKREATKIKIGFSDGILMNIRWGFNEDKKGAESGIEQDGSTLTRERDATIGRSNQPAPTLMSSLPFKYVYIYICEVGTNFFTRRSSEKDARNSTPCDARQRAVRCDWTRKT